MLIKDASLHLRIPSDLREALEEAASADGRKLSDYVERILQDWRKAKKRAR